jgi:hypothetical protein
LIAGKTILLTTPDLLDANQDETRCDVNLTFDTSPAALYDEPLKIRVKDKNGIKNDRVLGRAHIDSEKAVARLGRWVDITGDLLDDEGNPAGVYHLKGRYLRNSDQPNEEVVEMSPRMELKRQPLSTEPGVLEIQEVGLKNLPSPGSSPLLRCPFQA